MASIRVETLDELACTLLLFADRPPRESPDRSFPIHDSGGECEMFIDLANARAFAFAADRGDDQSTRSPHGSTRVSSPPIRSMPGAPAPISSSISKHCFGALLADENAALGVFCRRHPRRLLLERRLRRRGPRRRRDDDEARRVRHQLHATAARGDRAAPDRRRAYRCSTARYNGARRGSRRALVSRLPRAAGRSAAAVAPAPSARSAARSARRALRRRRTRRSRRPRIARRV